MSATTSTTPAPRGTAAARHRPGRASAIRTRVPDGIDHPSRTERVTADVES